MTIAKQMPEFAPGVDREQNPLAPDDRVRFGWWAAEALRAGTARFEFESRGPSEEKPRPYVRPSDAGKCARQLYYVAVGAERTDPMDGAGAVSTTLGTFLGAVLANALVDNIEAMSEDLGRKAVEVIAEHRVASDGPDGEMVPANVDTADGPVPVNGFVDIVVVWDDGTETVIEVKSTGDYAFKATTGRGRSKIAEGPDVGHVRQLAEYALLRPNATEGVVIYLATNPISKPVAAKMGLGDRDRVAAEWTFTREQLVEIGSRELRRHRLILDHAAEGTPPPRRIPTMSGGEVVNPSTGAWKSEDGKSVQNAWMCGYCGWQRRCAEDLVAERGQGNG